MAERRPLVVIDGQVQELPSGDTTPGSGGGGTSAFAGFRATRITSVQSIPTADHATIIFNGEAYDTENAYDAATGVFTVPASLNGKYMVFTGGIEVNTAAPDLSIYIAINGTIVARTRATQFSNVISTPPLLLATGNTIQLAARSYSIATNVQTTSQSFFSGYVVDPVTSAGGGAATFLELTDTPPAYTGHGGKLVAVNTVSSGLEFIDPPTAGTVAIEDEGTEILATAARINFTGAGVTVADAGSGEATVTIPGPTPGITAFTGLTDTPANYTGQAGKYLGVNQTEDAVVFLEAPDLGPNEDVIFDQTFSVVSTNEINIPLSDEYEEYRITHRGLNIDCRVRMSNDGGLSYTGTFERIYINGNPLDGSLNSGAGWLGSGTPGGVFSIQGAKYANQRTVVQGINSNSSTFAQYELSYKTEFEKNNFLRLSSDGGTFTAGRLQVIGIKSRSNYSGLLKIQNQQSVNNPRGGISATAAATKGNRIRVNYPIDLKNLKFFINSTARSYEAIVATMTNDTTIGTVLGRVTVAGTGGEQELTFAFTTPIRLEPEQLYFIGLTDKSGDGTTQLTSHAGDAVMTGVITPVALGGTITDNNIQGAETFTPFGSSYVHMTANYDLVFDAVGVGNIIAQADPIPFAGFRVMKNAQQTMSVSTTTEITWQTIDFDTHNGFAGNHFTVPESLNGKYGSFYCALNYTTSTGTAALYIQRSTDGGTNWGTFCQVEFPSEARAIGLTGPVLLTTGHKWRLAVFVGTGIILNNVTSTFFSMAVLDPGIVLPGKQISHKTISGAYTLLDSDLIGNVYMTADTTGGPCTITIPDTLTGTEPVLIEREGANNVIFAAGGATVIRSADNYLKLRTQYSVASIIPKGGNVYSLSGDLTL